MANRIYRRNCAVLLSLVLVAFAISALGQEVTARLQGSLTDAEVHTHPMRNYVEQCLGGEPNLPQIAIGEPKPLMAGDVVLLCSDGFWAPLADDYLAWELGMGLELQTLLDVLAREAEERASPTSDNVTAVALRWME